MKNNKLDLIDPRRAPNDLMKIECANCGHVGRPMIWIYRYVFGIIFLIFALIPGIVFFFNSNPYVCENCKRREKLTKIKNNKQKAPIGGMSKKSFIIISILTLFSLLTLTIFSSILNSIDNEVADKSNLTLEDYDKTGEIEESAEKFEDLAAQASSTENKVELFKNAGYMYSSNLENDKAMENFSQALALSKENTFDWYLISGEIKYLEGDSKGAIKNFKLAYDKNPSDYQINNALGLFYLDLEGITPEYVNYNLALKYLTKANNLTDSETAKENLAIAYIHNGNYDSAIELFQETNLNEKAYNNLWLSLAYYGKEDIQKGNEYLKKAYNLDSESIRSIPEMEPLLEEALNT